MNLPGFPIIKEFSQYCTGDIGIIEVAKMILELFDLIDQVLGFFSKHLAEKFQRVTQFLKFYTQSVKLVDGGRFEHRTVRAHCSQTRINQNRYDKIDLLLEKQWRIVVEEEETWLNQVGDDG